ncbi:MAG: RHS repeat domain-containing protein, partial [Bacteroidota bacterium]
MKSTKRLMPVAVTAVLSMLLFVSGTFAQNRNDLLIMQSLDKPNETALTQLSIGMHNDWREAGVRKMRIQMDGDQPGTYNKIVDFDAKGNVARKEVADGETYAYDYDKQDRIKRVTTYKDGAEASAQYFYYDRKGDLRKSVLKTGEKNKEIVGLYNKYNHLDRVQYYTKGMMTKSLVIKYVYNDAGLVTSMRTPDLKASYLYADGQLAQFREEAVGKTKQINVKWGENGLAGLKKYEEKDGDMILMETVAFEYNTAGLVARKTVKPRDPNAETKIKNVFYDAFGEGAMAVRADWDGGGYGYGTPVIIKWSNPDLDTRVTDKNVPIKFSLKPGVGQEMPDIKAMTLRLNHKDTKKEIGNVVLKKKGDGN